jgi:hypothetical protein
MKNMTPFLFAFQTAFASESAICNNIRCWGVISNYFWDFLVQILPNLHEIPPNILIRRIHDKTFGVDPSLEQLTVTDNERLDVSVFCFLSLNLTIS